MFDVELFKQNPAMWGGKLACELAVGILTRGASAAGTRLGKQLADLPGLLRKIDDWLTGRNNGNNDSDDSDDSDGDGKPGTCATGSFSGSTPVLLADGTTKPISQVRVGDLVLATDPTSGTTGARVVVATLPHVDALLTLRTSAGEIVTTEDHEYWNVTESSWQESQDLDPGDQLLDSGGAIVLVQGLDWGSLRTAAAYDLTVDDLHSYHVGAGDKAVLVHNCGPLEGKRNHDVFDPATGNRITDIDHIEDGTLWEEKTAAWAIDEVGWANKHMRDKFERYMAARRSGGLPGYENAPIGFRLPADMQPALRQQVMQALDDIAAANPGVIIKVSWQ